MERVTRQLGMHAGGCYGPGYERGSKPLVGVGTCEPMDGRNGSEGGQCFWAAGIEGQLSPQKRDVTVVNCTVV